MASRAGAAWSGALLGAGLALAACPCVAALPDAPVQVAAHEGAEPPSTAEKLARALAYEHGEGVPKDERIAAAIYCDAAVAGSAEAAFQLGWM
jgi:TPR repeat protein